MTRLLTYLAAFLVAAFVVLSVGAAVLGVDVEEPRPAQSDGGKR